MIGAGFFLSFCGRKLFSAAIFMVGAIATACGILILFYTTALKSTTEAWVGWLMLAVSIIVGLIVGFFLMRAQKVGAAVLAGWAGFMCGLFINESILYVA